MGGEVAACGGGAGSFLATFGPDVPTLGGPIKRGARLKAAIAAAARVPTLNARQRGVNDRCPRAGRTASRSA